MESTHSVEPYSLSGLTCRSAVGAYCTVQVNGMGLVLIYRWAGSQQILGRRTSPKDVAPATEIQLAIECVGGHTKLGSAPHRGLPRRGTRGGGDRPESHLQEGNVGMFAQTVGAPSTTSYDDIRIVVPAE